MTALTLTLTTPTSAASATLVSGVQLTAKAAHVTLTSLNASILDSPTGADAAATTGDAAADVVGQNITLFTRLGGVASTSNFLEIDSSNYNGAALNGLLNVTSLNGVYITEVGGPLRVDRVYSALGDVSLANLNGSIVDGRNDDDVNVIGNSIDLDANGGSVGELANDLEIDSSFHTPGDVGMEAGTRAGNGSVTTAGSIYVTETRGTLHLVLAEAIGGDVRITVRERTPDSDAARAGAARSPAPSRSTARRSRARRAASSPRLRGRPDAADLRRHAVRRRLRDRHRSPRS